PLFELVTPQEWTDRELHQLAVYMVQRHVESLPEDRETRRLANIGYQMNWLSTRILNVLPTQVEKDRIERFQDNLLLAFVQNREMAEDLDEFLKEPEVST